MRVIHPTEHTPGGLGDGVAGGDGDGGVGGGIEGGGGGMGGGIGGAYMLLVMMEYLRRTDRANTSRRSARTILLTWQEAGNGKKKIVGMQLT